MRGFGRPPICGSDEEGSAGFAAVALGSPRISWSEWCSSSFPLSLSLESSDEEPEDEVGSESEGGYEARWRRAVRSVRFIVFDGLFEVWLFAASGFCVSFCMVRCDWGRGLSPGIRDF